MTNNETQSNITRNSYTRYKLGVTHNELDKVQRLISPMNIELVAFEGNGLSLIIVSKSSHQIVDSLPNDLIGFVALNGDSLKSIEEMASLWQSYGEAETPPCYLVKKHDPSSLLISWIADQVILANAEQARRNVSLMRELSNLRIMHEETQNAFHLLERFAELNFALKRNLALALEPCNQVVTLSSDLTQLTQLIPIVSVGVCDIAIHIPNLPTELTGKLIVTLHAIESGREVAKWMIPAQSLHKKWVQLSLAEALGVDEQSLTMTVTWTGPGSISLSTGPSHPDPKWCAVVQGSPAGRALALKVWRSLPSTRPTKSAATHAETQLFKSRWIVDSDQMKNIKNVNGPTEYIQYNEPIDAVLVHPINTSPIIAKLELSAPKGALVISADIENGNKDAGLIEYAIAVAAPQANTNDAKQIKFKPGHTSDWVGLEGGAKTEIHLFLPTALQEAEDIYLATRLKKGDSNENCWAYFRKVRISA